METLLILLAFFLSFILVVLSIPPILKVARAKKLFDSFDERKIHTGSIPPLGGIALFIGFILSTIIATDGLSFDCLKYIIAAVILMFFIGLKDDLLIISARKKFIVQFFAAVVLITLEMFDLPICMVCLGFMKSVMGKAFPYFFAMIAIVNSFNLIDGIDGLASGLAMLASTLFGIWFFVANEIQFSIMSFALVGSLCGFFLFNVFGHRNKLFMGDTGSLIVGLIISTLVIKFNEFNIFHRMPFTIEAAPAISFAVIIVPLIDMIRVMTIRIWHKKSPFYPDKNHIHHKLLILVPTHLKVTLILVFANALIVVLALLMNNLALNVNIQFFIIFLTGLLFSFIPGAITRSSSFKTEKVQK